MATRKYICTEAHRERLRANMKKARAAAEAKRASGGTPLPADLSKLSPQQFGAYTVNSGLTPEQRFWLKIQKSDGCWEWLGQRNHKGYGEISINGSWKKAHRFAWEIANGPIPKGILVCHTCDNRACVRLDHLFVGTNSDNQRDAVKKGRGPSPTTLTSQDVRVIRGLLNQRVSMKAVAYRLGVSYASILRIKHRKAFAYVE